MEVVGLIGMFILIILGPLTAFTPKLVRTKRKGLEDYGLLANRYVEKFEKKWVLKDASNRDELLGVPDIQSLADLGNSYAFVREMRPVPFSMQDTIRLAVVTAAPLTPLALTIFSIEELVMRLAKVIF